jgi:TetR/AcrR family transcriptional repressor of lmrAB and yxaGH operons
MIPMSATRVNDPADPAPTRERLISTAARLFRERGVTGTGLLTILQAARAPRGSLYHHFPGGKDELTLAALQYEADRVTTGLEALIASVPDPATATRRFAEALAVSLEQSDFRLGCPVSTAALELSSESDSVRLLCVETYGRWQQLLAETLQRNGLTHGAAAGHAELTLAALEGSLLLARARRDADVIRRVGAALAPPQD